MPAETIKAERQTAQDKAKQILAEHGIGSDNKSVLMYTTVAQQLRDTVTDTEGLRQRMGHEAIAIIFRRWVGESHKDARLIETARDRLPEECGWIIEMLLVGLAGLGRIEHVDANSELKGIIAQNGDTEPILSRIQAVQLLHKRLDTPSLPPRTIDGNTICWPAETAQDGANTAKITGDIDKAREILASAIETTNMVITKSSLRMVLENPDDTETQRFKGAISAVGVLYARLGNLNHDLCLLRLGLNKQRIAEGVQSNPHRLITLATWTLAGAISSDFEATRTERVIGIVESGLVLAHGLIFHREPTVSSLKQFLIERKLRK